MIRVSALFLLVTALAGAESPLAVPHIADGGGWRSTIAIFNGFSSEAAQVNVKFRSDSGVLQDVSVLNYGVVRSLDLELAPNTSIYLETAGVRAGVQVGWAEINQSSGNIPVRAFAVFRQTIPGRPDYEAVATGMRASNGLTFPFDNTGGLTTSFAIANLANSACTVGVSPIRDESGRLLADGPKNVVGLLGSGHAAFISTDLLPETAGKRGYLQFYPAGCGAGGLAMVGLRFNPSGPFTNLQPLSVESPF
jgi:hypothetical protein